MRDRGAIILGDKRAYNRGRRTLTRRLTTIGLVVFGISYVSWSVESSSTQVRIKQALVDISRIEHAVRLFRADLGRCPQNMEELITPPGEQRYMTARDDPWGMPYMLICPARFDPGGVEVISGGPDRTFKGDDNISSL